MENKKMFETTNQLSMFVMNTPIKIARTDRYGISDHFQTQAKRLSSPLQVQLPRECQAKSSKAFRNGAGA